MIINVIIPAHNEQESISYVLNDIPDFIDEVIVVDNNSNDKTAELASLKATVLEEKRQGYGYACLKGLDYISQKSSKPDVVVFLDADYSDYPEEVELILAPILSEGYDMVIGSRSLGSSERGSMMPQQIFGNWLATRLINLIFKYKYTDLGPFRAIKYDALTNLGMVDTTYGWTVEMQIKAVKNKLIIKEVPVSYRNRIGKSKISGTLKGSLLAGYKILTTIFKYY